MMKDIANRLNQYLGIDIDSSNWDSVRNFLVLWNQFEAKLFNCSFSATGAINKSGILKINGDTIANTLHYFQRRYLTNGKTNDHFLRLKFRANDDKPLVEDVLFGNNKNDSDIIAAIK